MTMAMTINQNSADIDNQDDNTLHMWYLRTKSQPSYCAMFRPNDLESSCTVSLSLNAFYQCNEASENSAFPK